MLNHIQQFGVKVVGAGTILTLTLLSSALSASAAEKVVLKYGPFARSVSVDSLTNYASTGEATGNLASLLRVVKADQRQSMMGLLNTKLPFGVVQVDKLMRSPIGEQFLNDMASATILPGGEEVKALRAAAILASAQDKSLSFGTLLQKYPTQTLTVDLPVLMKVLKTNPAVGALLGGGTGSFGAPGASQQQMPK